MVRQVLEKKNRITNLIMCDFMNLLYKGTKSSCFFRQASTDQGKIGLKLALNQLFIRSMTLFMGQMCQSRS